MTIEQSLKNNNYVLFFILLQHRPCAVYAKNGTYSTNDSYSLIRCAFAPTFQASEGQVEHSWAYKTDKSLYIYESWHFIYIYISAGSLVFVIQTHKRFKITLFTGTNHNMRIFRVIPFIEMTLKQYFWASDILLVNLLKRVVTVENNQFDWDGWLTAVWKANDQLDRLGRVNGWILGGQCTHI